MVGSKPAAEPAPAKINLALHVVGRRADGYHLLESLSVFTAYGDHVAVAPAPRDLLTVDGPFAAETPNGPENIAARARDALREAVGPQSAPPVLTFLHKNVPVMAGMGGGSSDAAAVLRALTRLWDLKLDRRRLAAIGATLGADVPMCLSARPLLARGIGDEIAEVDRFPLLRLVLVNPRVPVATADVFAALAERNNPPLPALPARLDESALIEWLGSTRNDLLRPAAEIAPAIGEALAALSLNGAAFARMSGSGATCFGIFSSQAAAERAAAAIASARPGWFVTATETTASAPAEAAA